MLTTAILYYAIIYYAILYPSPWLFCGQLECAETKTIVYCTIRIADNHIHIIIILRCPCGRAILRDRFSGRAISRDRPFSGLAILRDRFPPLILCIHINSASFKMKRWVLHARPGSSSTCAWGGRTHNCKHPIHIALCD
jgi:hypothetical protein